MVQLMSSGERTVNDGEIYAGIVYITSMIPDSTQFCEASGEGWLYVLDYKTGGSPSEVMIDINGDEVFDESDKGDGMAVAGKKYTGGFISSPIMDLKRSRAIVKVGQDIETMGVRLPSGVESSNMIYWREVF
nr:hypothetical protein [Desulfobacterales bacterium]